MDHPEKKVPREHCSIYVKYLFNILDHQHTNNSMRIQRKEEKTHSPPQKKLKISNFQELQNVQKINVLLLGQVTEVFSFFTVNDCIALLIKTY